MWINVSSADVWRCPCQDPDFSSRLVESSKVTGRPQWRPVKECWHHSVWSVDLMHSGQVDAAPVVASPVWNHYLSTQKLLYYLLITVLTDFWNHIFTSEWQAATSHKTVSTFKSNMFLTYSLLTTSTAEACMNIVSRPVVTAAALWCLINCLVITIISH